MIGMLRGRVIKKSPPFMMLDVNGVGYEIEAPMSTFYALPLNDEPIVLHMHLAIRDDAHVLYGFFEESDKVMFRALLKVSGVGGKMALAILSGMTATEFGQTIQNGDVVSLTRIPGVGKKTAERLIVEMRDRVEKLDLENITTGLSGGVQASLGPLEEAQSALVALGYKAADVAKMTKQVDSQDLSTEAIIKAALQLRK